MSTNPTDSSSQDVPQSSLTAPNDRTDKMFRIGRQDILLVNKQRML